MHNCNCVHVSCIKSVVQVEELVSGQNQLDKLTVLVSGGITDCASCV